MVDLSYGLRVARGVRSTAIVGCGWLSSLYCTAGRSGNSASRQRRLADASAGGAGVACWLRQVELDLAAHTTLDRAPFPPTALRSLRLSHTREGLVSWMTSRFLALHTRHFVKVPVIAVQLADGTPLHMCYNQSVLKVDRKGNVQVKRP